MPAASDSLPRTWRPIGPLIVGATLVLVLGTVSGMSWVALGPEVRAEFTTFELLTLAFIGLLILGCIHAIGRSRVVASVEGLTIVNGYRRHELAWSEIAAIRMPAGAPWARVMIDDDEFIPAMGIQGSDGARAHEAVGTLRALLAEFNPS